MEAEKCVIRLLRRWGIEWSNEGHDLSEEGDSQRKTVRRFQEEKRITVKDPQGQVIATVNLPAGETIFVEAEFKEPGTYKFYCNKPLHSTLGMNGKIVVMRKT
jgi:uncharacterized cupredoxin-like copper-binding protein